MAKIERQAWLIQFDGGVPYLNNYAPKGSGYTTIAGPVSVTFDVPNSCPHCGGVLPEDKAPAKAEPLPFVVEVGGKYRTLGGDVAHILTYDGPDITYCMLGFVAGRESCWTETGEWYRGEPTDYDLVERIS